MTSVESSSVRPLVGLKFKGDRQYLQGPDIFVAALNAIAADSNIACLNDIDVVFHSMARSGLSLAIDLLPSGTEPVVQITCRVGDLRQKFYLIDDGRPILERYDYAEDQIVAATDISVSTASATSSMPMPYTDIERWVAMVKALHYALYPEVRGKWLFVRGKFSHYPGTYQLADIEQQVRVEANFNNKLTRSALLVDGKKLGDIFFSLD